MNLGTGWLTHIAELHGVISNGVKLNELLCLFVLLPYFRSDRFVPLLIIIPILILPLCLVVSIDLVYIGIGGA